MFCSVYTSQKNIEINVSLFFPRYGDLYSVEFGGNLIVLINKLEIAQELFSQDVFSGRIDPEQLIGYNFGAAIKGGNGNNGIIASWGPTWREQRRFALR